MIQAVRILYIEPFDTGSHAQFTRVLTEHHRAQWTVLSLPGRHWKWRMRGAMLHFADSHRGELDRDYDLILASSYLPLAELVAFAPKLASVPKIIYFHENQLTYPVLDERERDTHFGFTQLVSASLADHCLFNSEFNKTSFITAANDLIQRMPDARPTWALNRIATRSTVLPLPMDLPEVQVAPSQTDPRGPLILWNHRWEHDKNPESFFTVLRRLKDASVAFRVAVCGERFRRCPDIFDDAEDWLGDAIEHWGYLERSAYEDLMARADCVISTAHHEFFGLSVLEAIHYGCRPFVPDRLSYPELLPAEFRYSDDAMLLGQVTKFCRDYQRGECMRKDRRELTQRYAIKSLLPEYAACFSRVIRRVSDSSR